MSQRTTPAMRLGLAALVMLLVAAWAVDGQAVDAAIARNARFGFVHIGYGDRTPEAPRYQRASTTGVGTHRWAMYWNYMEPRPGEFTFASQELTATWDANNDLDTLAILFGTPSWASTAPPRPPTATVTSTVQSAPIVPADDLWSRQATPQADDHFSPSQQGPRIGPQPSEPGIRSLSEADQPVIAETVYPPRNLDLPIFADGTDTFGPNKEINQENYWARYVQRVVAKFKGRVHYWEIWNEPDFRPRADNGWFGFWNGNARQYARLLKVAYLAAKSVDPNATIVMAGMMHWQDQGFFAQILQALRAEPDGAQHGYFFDATSWHWYSRASLAYEKTAWVRQQLNRFGMGSKRIWITESNLPVCGDEGTGGFPRCEPGRHRGTPDEQAAFIVQTAAYSVAAAVERTLYFQLQDDQLGPGDFYGLTRNDGAPRPGFAAARVVTTHFRDVERVHRTRSAGGTIELITMYRKDGARVMVAWAANDERRQLSLPAESTTATLVAVNGQTQPIVAKGEGFAVELPPATLNDAPPGTPPDFIVGGQPIIIVEPNVTYREGTLAGTVRDTANRPVADYPVHIGSQTIHTDASGRFSLSLPPGLYDAEVGRRLGYMPRTHAYAVPVRGGATVERTLTVNPLHMLRLPIVAKGGQAR